MKPCFTLLLLYTVIISSAQTWEHVGPDGIDIASLVSKNGKLYAGTAGNTGGLYVSASNGDEWVQINTGLPLDGSLVHQVEVVNETMLAATGARGIYHSPDSGATWTLLNGQPGGLLIVRDILTIPGKSNIVVAGGVKLEGKSGAAISEIGEPWITISNGLPLSGGLNEFLLVDTILYSANSVGVYKVI